MYLIGLYKCKCDILNRLWFEHFFRSHALIKHIIDNGCIRIPYVKAVVSYIPGVGIFIFLKYQNYLSYFILSGKIPQTKHCILAS